MQKFLRFNGMASFMLAVGFMVMVSCDKDDDKPPVSSVSFASESDNVAESDGTVEVTLQFDKPLSEEVVLKYSLEGTATEGENEDYEISAEGGFITVEEGASQATIEIELYEDWELELDVENEIAYETIVLTLTEVIKGPVSLEGQLQYTLNVYEDDMIISLSWESEDVVPTDVDMDIFVWYNNPEDQPDEGWIPFNGEFVGGINAGTDGEAVLLPGGLPEGDYGFSYIYYGGSSDDVSFVVDFINIGGTVDGQAEVMSYSGTLGLANINAWDTEEGSQPVIVQTAEKSGLNYDNLSDIERPESGSRRKVDLSSFNRFEHLKSSEKSPLKTAAIKALKLKESTRR